MILVDTSVWIDHLRSGNKSLMRLLEEDQVLIHRWVLGELALGSLAKRSGFLDLLSVLPLAPTVADEEISACIEKGFWYARGIGWVDAGILASALNYPCALYTLDKRLSALAEEFGIRVMRDTD